ncbi:hypothetical protein FVD64_15140, partial [Enterococcus faecium]|nr:hypothetical protein [Enterococcus faecium]
NQVVRRREQIIHYFTYQKYINRIIGDVLMNLHDEWIYSSSKYINFDKKKCYIHCIVFYTGVWN